MPIFQSLNSLYAKLALGLFLVLLLSGLAFVFISTAFTRHYMQELSQKLNTDLAKNLVAERNLVQEGRINHQAIVDTFARYMSYNPSIEIYLLDLKGRIKAYSADPKRVKRNSVALGPIGDFLNMTEPFPLLGDDPRSMTRQKAFSVTAIPSKENPEGYLYVVLRGEQHDLVERALRDSYTFQLGIWAAIASLGLGLLAGLAVFRLLTLRLERLALRMQAFTAFATGPGEAKDRVTEAQGLPRPAAGDEVDRLGLSFRHMTARIKSQIAQLQDKDMLRRNLIAQIGHDLRTPLASLQGYIESLQIKGDTLPADEKEKFLDVALRQSRRLSGMVEELVELAGLDAREQLPEMEPFSLIELIYDVAQKHNVEADEKGITMTVAAAPELPTVRGNVGMTERILDNLLRNGLYYTPRGGHIDLGLQEEADIVRVSISDTGPGIEDQDIPHIFEPFYQGANRPAQSDTPSGNGSGLGLAIARRMVELQNGNIGVRNKSGNGARFFFELPRV